MNGATTEVFVFRRHLFKTSEPFIAQQANALEAFRPVFVGECLVNAAPHGAVTVALSALADEQSVRRYRRTRRSRLLRDALRELAAPIMHAHFGMDAVYALPLARELGIPCLTTLHGLDATMRRRQWFRHLNAPAQYYGLLRGRLASHGDLFICVSEYIRRVAERIGVPAERTVTHYIGIDAEEVFAAPFPREPVVAHVARLVESKGTADLLRAFAILAPAYPDWKVEIIGDGPEKARLLALAAALGIERRVEFRGERQRDEALRLMRRASVLCVPSVTARAGNQEGLGMVLLEAAASATPVVATDHGGIPEVVVDGVTGFLVPEHGPGELAERLRTLMSTESIAARLGGAARARVEAAFDIRRQTRVLEGIYGGLVG
jgi:glycosyltransferase involved in cell wall biosynthesis